MRRASARNFRATPAKFMLRMAFPAGWRLWPCRVTVDDDHVLRGLNSLKIWSQAAWCEIGMASTRDDGDRSETDIEKIGSNGMRLTTVDTVPKTGKSIVTSQTNLQRRSF